MPGDLLAGPVPLAARRRARRRADQPGQRARLPLRPRQPARPAARRAIVAASTAAWASASTARPGSTADRPARRAGSGSTSPVSGFALALYALAERLGVRRDEYELVHPRLDPAPARGAARRRLRRDHAQRRQRAASPRRRGCVRLAGAQRPLLARTSAPSSPSSATSTSRRRPGWRRARPDRRGAIVGRRARRGGAESAAGAGSTSTPSWRSGTSSGCGTPLDGLVPDGVVDPAALWTTLVRLRTTLPAGGSGGGDGPLDGALDDGRPGAGRRRVSAAPGTEARHDPAAAGHHASSARSTGSRCRRCWSRSRSTSTSRCPAIVHGRGRLLPGLRPDASRCGAWCPTGSAGCAPCG